MSNYYDDDDKPGGASKYDGAVILFVIGMLFLIGAIAFGAYKVYEHNAEAPLKQACESNPRLRYTNNCTTYDDCVQQCVTVLRRAKNPNG